MEILIYNEIDLKGVKKTFDKVVEQLKKGDFASAEIKKMQNTAYYRAKMDYEDRLLFKFAKIEGTTYLLLLEVIKNHDYEKSRFLRGAEIDESKLHTIAKPEKIPVEDLTPIAYVNPQNRHFHLLDKIISFDEDQNTIFRLPAPVIIIGSAGSGKTALTLEKIKTLKGNILYVTLSPYLVESAANLYYSFNYENEEQEIDFLSFKDFVQSLQVIEGKEITFKEFDTWFIRYRNNTKIKDSYKLFEEFRGVLTGNDITKPYLSKADYLSLGVRQSVFFQDEREQVYSLFEKYLQFLSENKYYDLNIVSYQWLQFVENKYDFVIVDEVQDLTNAQLYLILKSLQNSSSFVLCGDSNQIVHPNFFSWSNVKSMFYKTDMLDNDVRILKTNYRNSPEVTTLANTLLKIKHLRFGSVDRESTYLVSSISSKKGEVVYLEDTTKVKQDLNQKTKSSTRFAVLVMNNTDKAEARKY
ncbi:MAG TPA: PhoH family protein, partial [Chitinophagales bacterium]|nr:PhoH family protein [Chitinophagales bacterium]